MQFQVDAYHRVRITYKVQAPSEQAVVEALQGLLIRRPTLRLNWGSLDLRNAVIFGFDPDELEARGVVAIDGTVDQYHNPAPTKYKASTPQNQFEDRWNIKVIGEP